MFTLGIPLKQKRRTLGYLSNEYFPGGMKKLGQQVPYEIISTDRKGGFFVISFPNMDEYEFRNIVFQLKQQGVTVIGADSQLTEKTMKLVNLVPLKESLQVTTNDGKVAIISDPEDIKTFYRGGTVFGDDSDGDSIELSKETSLDFQSMGFRHYQEDSNSNEVNEGRINGPFNYKTLSNIARKDDSALAFIPGNRIYESGFFVSLELDGLDPNDPESFFGLKEDGESVEVRYDEVDFVETSIVDEGSCGYAPEGEDPNEADQPAGSHLLRKKIREIIQEKMKHPQYKDASNQYAQRGKSTKLSPEKKAAQKDRFKSLAQRIKDLDKEKDIDESYVDDPNVPGVTGMEDAVNDPNAKAEKILMSLAKSFGNIPLEKVVNDSTYKRQAITSILFGMMNEDAS